MLIAPKQKYKEPKAGHFTRIQVLPAFDLVGRKKGKKKEKKRKNSHKKPGVSTFRAFL